MKEQVNTLYNYWKRRHWRGMHKRAKAHDPQVAVAMEDVPQGLQGYWERHGPNEFPGMPTSAESWAWWKRNRQCATPYLGTGQRARRQTGALGQHSLPLRGGQGGGHASGLVLRTQQEDQAS